MKTAMKKLLSLMLVAVLLVSAVPFQASAEVLGDSGDDLIVDQSNDDIIDPQTVTPGASTYDVPYKITGAVQKTGSVKVQPTSTLPQALASVLPANYAKTYWVNWYKNETKGEENWQVGTNATSIGAELTVKQLDVSVSIEGVGTGSVKALITDTLTLNEALVNTAGLQVPAGKKIINWTVNCNAKSTGTKISVDYNLTIVAILGDSNTNTDGGSNNGGSNNGGSNTATTVAFVVKVDGNTQTVNGSQTQYVTPSEGKDYVVVSNLIKYYFDKNWTAKYDFSHYWISGEGNTTHKGDNALNDQISVGKEIHVALTTKGTTTTQYTVKFFNANSSLVKSYKVNKGESVSLGYVETAASAATPSGYTFLGWKPEGSTTATYYSNEYIAGRTIDKDTNFYAVIKKNTTNDDDNGSSGKFPYSVYLHIYAKGNVSTPIKTVTLDSWTCVKDGVVTLDELKEVVKSFYTAKNDDGIGYDGIYYSTSSTKTDYVNDTNKTARISNLDELRKEGYVHLNVWIDNYKAKTSSTADSSNPKTGDTIIMTVTVMGLSTAALAAVYYISKKRAVR